WVPYVVVALRPGPELAVPDAVRWAGLALAVAGCAFAAWAAGTLGEHFDVEIEVHERHAVVRSGPYAIVRHPVYSGLALHFVGACLATGNLALALGTLLVSFPALWLRAATEERLLRRELGAAYDAYAREVPMLVPFPRG
ncbi:MAG: methyltransferase family protein, partial [Candidatus Limnocylindria bacterium]